MTELTFYDDPAAFLADTEEFLEREPVINTVIASVTARAAAADLRGEVLRHDGDTPRWWVAVREKEEVVGVAMRTAPIAPHWLFLLPMSEGAARALARALHERGEEALAFNGAMPAAMQAAEEMAGLVGRTVHVHEHTRLWELGDLLEPVPPLGRLRRAVASDRGLVLRWWTAFDADAAEQAGRDGIHDTLEIMELDEIARRIEDGLVWLWEDQHGQVVHLTAHNPPAYGVARVGPVYTPKSARGHGYASGTVSAVSRHLLDHGLRACLYTDQANPTSNKIYEAIGYRPVVDMVNLLLL